MKSGKYIFIYVITILSYIINNNKNNVLMGTEIQIYNVALYSAVAALYSAIL